VGSARATSRPRAPTTAARVPRQSTRRRWSSSTPPATTRPSSSRFNARWGVSWHSIRGHDRVVEELRRSLQQGRFPHALLFVGPEGIGKRSLARKLAQALLCEARSARELDPCEACPGCLQVAAGTHPDFLE